jgi:RNA polymerase sigma-70 factor (ECF subfamily)
MLNSFVYNISSLNSPTDKDLLSSLVAKAKAGNRSSFGEIYNLFFQKIYRFIFYRVGHKETAEDLTEEVFLKAFGKISGLSNNGTFEGWLYQIARNLVIDYYREKKVLIDIQDLENTLEYESNVVDVLNLQNNQKIILQVLKQLPSDQQTVLKLKFFEELDNSAIAEILEKTEGAVRVIQHRGLTKLKELTENLEI